MRRADWTDLAALGIVLLGLALRLREPLSSPVIGAEDPYLRMTDAWDVVHGRGFPDSYPPGFALLLAPFALMGPEAFYWVARFLPTLFGAVQIAGVYLLGRAYLRPVPTLAGALVVALIPENIFRTNLLFPTGLDLALLPFVFLLVLRASEGSARAAWGAAALAALMLVYHPWVVALLVPTVGLFALALLARQRRRVVPLVAGAGAGGIALGVALAYLPGTWNPTHAFFENAGPRLVELIVNPASLHPLPVHVNLPNMLTVPFLALALAGAAAALWRRERLDLLALLWSAFILPFVLVDWFEVWFIPHRSVAYLSVGVALLAAVAFDAVARFAHERRAPRALALGGGAAALALVLVVSLPAAASVEPWYRLYDEDDYEAWEAVAAMAPERVIAGSWQAAEGYAAVTGQAAAYNPTFFEDGGVRDAMLREEPHTVVLVDRHARDNGHPRDFLHGWKKVGEWGESEAFVPW